MRKLCDGYLGPVDRLRRRWGVQSLSLFRNLAWHSLVPGRRRSPPLRGSHRENSNYGKGRDFDCVLGLSGGIDSSYLALKAFEWGLRPLVVHVDGGWNSELAVQNIECLVKHCNYELHTHVVNWVDMRELQLAFLRAGVANQDVPQDHAFFAGLYHFATKERVRFVLNGGNVATEGIFPSAWHGAAMDATNLRAIHKKFGSQDLIDYPLISFARYYFWYPVVKRMTPFRPLNLIPYSKDLAIKELEEIGWRAYPRKHGESIFTKFFQNYYLPTKFGYDKRRPHLSSLICSGQISRSAALTEISKPLYDNDELRRDIQYVSRKLQISLDEFERLMASQVHSYADFKNWDRRYAAMKQVQTLIRRTLRKDVSAYR